MIELLVVIAIVALVLAILIPSLRRVREQAKRTVCSAHVGGVGVALRMYVDDNDGKTHDSPNMGLWGNSWQNPPIWGKYGFVDSFNPHQDWHDDGFIGIDKGNEVLMIENFRSEGVWRMFMQNPFVQKGLEKAKFRLAN